MKVLLFFAAILSQACVKGCGSLKGQCLEDVNWAYDEGKKSSFAPGWYQAMEEISGVTYQKATKNDYQRLFVCDKKYLNKASCHLNPIPCDCSKPPCTCPVKMTKITIDVDMETLTKLGQTPEIVGEVTYENNVPETNTITRTISQTVADENSFTQSGGVSVTAGVEVEAKVPFIGGGTFSTETTVFGEWSNGETHREEKTVQDSLQCTAPPFSTIIFQLVAWKGMGNAQWTGTAYYEDGSHKEVSGVWEGVSWGTTIASCTVTGDFVKYNDVNIPTYSLFGDDKFCGSACVSKTLSQCEEECLRKKNCVGFVRDDATQSCYYRGISTEATHLLYPPERVDSNDFNDALHCEADPEFDVYLKESSENFQTNCHLVASRSNVVIILGSVSSFVFVTVCGVILIKRRRKKYAYIRTDVETHKPGNEISKTSTDV